MWIILTWLQGHVIFVIAIGLKRSVIVQFILLSVELWREMDSLFFWDTLDGVSNLGENANSNKEDTDDPEEQCQPPAEWDLRDQLVI